MQLSKRMQMVADCVTKGTSVADVGCDHAYISIYLVEHKIARHSVAMDINAGPLNSAKANIEQKGLGRQIQTRLSDGLVRLIPGEAESIILAGMGGALMVDILIQGEACVKAAKELILQPQSEAYKVRQFLHTYGWHIVWEDCCFDANKYYAVMRAVPEGSIEISQVTELKENSQLTAEQEFGGFLLAKRNPILKEYLKASLLSKEQICLELDKHPTEKANLRRIECEAEQQRIKEALAYYSLTADNICS